MPDCDSEDPRPRPAAAVFDLDGLLFNTEELYQQVGSELLRRRGHEFGAELLHAMMGRPARVALQMMIDYHALADTVETLSEETAEIFPAILDERLALMPGAADLLAALESADVPKAVATSSGRRFTRDVLGRFRLEPRFQFLLTAEDVVEGKPHPEIYLKAAARFGVAPGDIVVFEDSRNGCRAAVAAGTRAVAVPGGHSRTHDFSGATLIADTLADRRIYELLQIAL
ncbi:MAG TPA: HAD family phosphatase [Pirellulales bacterium]|jgi:HAD superfamily hydrolase (TIGR01509 family)|nr:HAD family phosphatase [Pirellulales bacterium]